MHWSLPVRLASASSFAIVCSATLILAEMSTILQNKHVCFFSYYSVLIVDQLVGGGVGWGVGVGAGCFGLED